MGIQKENTAEKIGIALAKNRYKIKQAEIMIDSLRKASENDNAFDIGIIYAWLGDKQKGDELSHHCVPPIRLWG